MELEFKQLINVDEEVLNTITKWMYDWWGKEKNWSFEEVKSNIKYSMNKDKLPQIYGLFLNGKIIGMYGFNYFDFSPRPDIYPWLTCVYIDEEYRGKGYGRELLKHVKETAQKNINFEEIFLVTPHIGLYEKFGWEYIEDVNTYNDAKSARLYKLDLK